MTARHLILTGATGYIGARVVEAALAQGRTVTLLGRRAGPAGTRHIGWTLGQALPAAALDVALAPHEQALIHLAHDWQGGESLNVEGTAALFASARAAGLGANVFISSQSAREAALNRYGRMKWAVEQRIADDTSLRVGLVYGGPRKAMFGLLCKLATLPVLPMVDPHRLVQPIHLDDVVRGILAAADGRARGVLALAGAEAVSFGAFLKALARGFGGRSLPIIPVPLKFALFACDMTAKLPLIPTVDRERVLGLAGTEPIDSPLDLVRLGIHELPLPLRLAREPAGRRALLGEARALLGYIGIDAGGALLRRYARAMPEGAIALPKFGLGWREPISARSHLARRLRAASRLAEASREGEAMLASGTRPVRLLRLALALAGEALRLPTRALASATLRQ